MLVWNDKRKVILYIVVAYLFSIAVRLIWVQWAGTHPEFFWNDQLMINTNDGYFFASGAEKTLWGMHADNPRVPGMWTYGTVFFTTLLAKVTPFSLETIILYMPAFISSLVVVPVILISRLYGKSKWGFFAALLGSIAWSYYNRTMIGYYDTDMFSAMAPMFILYFLMKSTIDFKLKTALWASLMIVIYPFLYDQGRSIIYAMSIVYMVYMIYYHRDEEVTYKSLILVLTGLLYMRLPIPVPFNYIVSTILVLITYMILQKKNVELQKLMTVTMVLFLLFLVFGNVFGLIWTRVTHYLATGTKLEGLHFYSVAQTVREAGHIPFSTFANRISGSMLGLFLSIIGYVLLVVRHRAFILALPLVGIGIFANWGGLRFTVYAVPVAAMAAVYLFVMLAEYITKDGRIRYTLVAIATGALIYPNITHIIGYKVPTVFNKAEVEDLTALGKIASPKDYTMAWWDYGYPIWYYADTATLIDGGKHHNDNFIISKIMQTDSPQLVANLARVAVETYVDSNYSIVTNTLFKNGEKDQKDPNLLLAELESGDYKLPQKTRDIYLYLPYRMMNIFPTVAVFGNLDLTTGKAERQMVFYPTRAVKNNNGVLQFANGIVFNTRKGELNMGRQNVPVKAFVVAQVTKDGKTHVQMQPYHATAGYIVLYLKSYGQFVVMDERTFRSTYVQMFMLGQYDHDLFELVVSSPYSKIYKLKK